MPMGRIAEVSKFEAEFFLELPRIWGVGRLECQVETTYPGGDHTIVIGRVIHCEPHDGNSSLISSEKQSSVSMFYLDLQEKEEL